MEVGGCLEYRKIDTLTYKKYQKSANEIIKKVCDYFIIDESKLGYQHIIKYFENEYNLHFHYLMYNFFTEFFDDATSFSPTKSDIKYPGLLSNPTISTAELEILSKCSGMTIPSGDKYLVMINQYDVPKSRVIFTILHELSHIFCHLENSSKKQLYVSLTEGADLDSYPDEIIPFEDEANTVASILFLTKAKLEKAFENNRTYAELIKLSGMSSPALHNRIMNYLMHDVGMSEYNSLRYTLDYREGGEAIFRRVKEEKERKQLLIDLFEDDDFIFG